MNSPLHLDTQIWSFTQRCKKWEIREIYLRGEREFPFPVIPKNGGLWFPFPNFGNGFFHSLPVPELTISKSGIKRENGRLWEMLVFQHFQLPLHFILHKNGGSKVKVAYCCLVIYELNSMSVSDYHPTCGRQFLATKMKVKWKFGMDIGQHGGLPSTPPGLSKEHDFSVFFQNHSLIFQRFHNIFNQF